MSTGLRFTETMTGFVTLDTTDFEAGYEAGRRVGMECTFTVTIRIPDVEQHLADPDHWALVEGHVYCPAFGRERRVSNGRFKLFDRGAGEAPIMRYRLPFVGDDGAAYELVGSKHLGRGRNPWKDTTRLETQIRRGYGTGLLEAATAPVVATGQVRITMRSFARQLTTMRGGPAAGRSFIAGFSRTLLDVYRPSRSGLPVEYASAA